MAIGEIPAGRSVRGRRDSLVRWATVLPVAGMLVLAASAQLLHGLNADLSWLLTVTERMLLGQRLYVDIYELNPPMSALLYLPFVWWAHTVAVAPEIVIVLAILATALAATSLSHRILGPYGLCVSKGEYWVLLVGGLTLLPGADFGEREHIALMLILPLLATSWTRSVGRRPGVWQILLVGAAAGLAMTIKPHFALPILLVAVYGAWRTHSWMPIFNAEHVLAGLLVVAYWTSVAIWFPEFFSTMLPLAQAAYIADRAPTLPFLLGAPVLPFWFLGAALLSIYRKEAATGFNPQLILAAVGFFLAYLLQGKGFTYHLLPSTTLLSIAVAQAFLVRNGDRKRLGSAVALALLLVTSSGLLSLRGDPYRRDAVAALAPLGQGLTIANISSQLELGSPLHRLVGGTLVNSGPCLWITLGARRLQSRGGSEETLAELAALEGIERELLRDDMLAVPPDVILTGGGSFDWIAWASMDPQLAALLEEYELFAEIGPRDRRFRLLKRES